MSVAPPTVNSATTSTAAPAVAQLAQPAATTALPPPRPPTLLQPLVPEDSTWPPDSWSSTTDKALAAGASATATTTPSSLVAESDLDAQSPRMPGAAESTASTRMTPSSSTTNSHGSKLSTEGSVVSAQSASSFASTTFTQSKSVGSKIPSSVSTATATTAVPRQPSTPSSIPTLELTPVLLNSSGTRQKAAARPRSRFGSGSRFLSFLPRRSASPAASSVPTTTPRKPVQPASKTAPTSRNSHLGVPVPNQAPRVSLGSLPSLDLDVDGYKSRNSSFGSSSQQMQDPPSPLGTNTEWSLPTPSGKDNPFIGSHSVGQASFILPERTLSPEQVDVLTQPQSLSSEFSASTPPANAATGSLPAPTPKPTSKSTRSKSLHSGSSATPRASPEPPRLSISTSAQTSMQGFKLSPLPTSGKRRETAPIVPTRKETAPKHSSLPVSKSRRLFANLSMSPAVPSTPAPINKNPESPDEPEFPRSRPRSRASLRSVTDMFRRPSSRMSVKEPSSPVSRKDSTKSSKSVCFPRLSTSLGDRDQLRQAATLHDADLEEARSPPPKRPGSALGNAFLSVRRRTASTPMLATMASTLSHQAAVSPASEGDPASPPTPIVQSSRTTTSPIETLPEYLVQGDEADEFADDGITPPTSFSTLSRNSSSAHGHKTSRHNSLMRNGTGRRLSRSMHSVFEISTRLNSATSTKEEDLTPAVSSQAGTGPNASVSLGPSFVRTGAHRGHRVQDMNLSPFETAFAQNLVRHRDPGTSTANKSPLRSPNVHSNKSNRFDTTPPTTVEPELWGKLPISPSPPTSCGDIHFPRTRSQSVRPKSRVELLNQPQPRDVRTLFPASVPQEPETKKPLEEAYSQPAPAFHIADDMEFLSAIETVRRQHKQHIRAASEQTLLNPKLLGPSGIRAAAPVRRLSDANTAAATSSGCLTPAVECLSFEPLDKEVPAPRRRSNSCSGYIGGEFRAHTFASSTPRSDMESENDSCAVDLPASRHWGTVGHASGKGQGGAAIVNDDDWKKEVKALFVIRELIQTERSYARNLECLLEAVMEAEKNRVQAHAKGGKDAPKRMLSAEVTAAPHIVGLITLLPRLIALSKRLVSQIEVNPTAAGVGASFRVLADQLQANFVGWSFTIADIMSGLRSTECSGRNRRGRIGMVYVSPDSTANRYATRSASTKSAVPPSPVQSTGGSTVPTGTTPAGTTVAEKVAFFSRPISPLPAPDSIAPLATTFGLEDERPQHGRGMPRSSSTLGFYPNARRAFGAAVRRQYDGSTSNSLPRSTNAGANPGGLPRPTPPHLDLQSAPSFPVPPRGKGLSSLDIVIMPTQRLPRYLLLLRDLQRHTPADSLSHIRLQKALKICRRIADLCDGASHSYTA